MQITVIRNIGLPHVYLIPGDGPKGVAYVGFSENHPSRIGMHLREFGFDTAITACCDSVEDALILENLLIAYYEPPLNKQGGTMRYAYRSRNRTPLTTEQRLEALRLRAEGKPWGLIGRELGLSLAKVYKQFPGMTPAEAKRRLEHV